jgi:hypothetical protein
MIALSMSRADRPATPPQDRNALLRILDAAAESRMRAFHRAMSPSIVPAADADGGQETRRSA